MDGWQENPIYWYDAAPPAGFPETVRSVAENRASFLPGFVDSACAEVLANVRDRHTTAAVRSIKLGIAISITRFLNPGGDVNGTKSGGIGREDDNSER